MFESIAPFAIFVFVMTGTPGPGNMLMMAIGQSQGFMRAIPFLIGTTLGCTFLNTSVALGLGEAFKMYPELSLILKIAGAAYILYLAVKLFKLQAASPEEVTQLSIVEGILVHPLSPKSWAMSVAAYSQFFSTLPMTLDTTALFVFTFMTGQITFHSLWCGFGAALFNSFKSERTRMAVTSSLVILMLGATFYALTS